MQHQTNYDVSEEEERLVIKLTRWRKRIRGVLYYLVCLSGVIGISATIFVFSPTLEILPIILLALFFFFLGMFFIFKDVTPEEIVIEPEKMVLSFNWYIGGKRKKEIHTCNIKKVAMRTIYLKGATRVEVFVILRDNTRKIILRFDYNTRNRESIESIYKKMAQKLHVEYENFQI